MTPEQLVDRLKEAMPAGLRSVVLYGSAAAGDHVKGKSDYNVMVVADRLGSKALKAVSKATLRWTESGNRPPLLFTPAELRQSADAFPIEILDIRQSRVVLFGEDFLSDVAVDGENLRLQLERELKVKLLSLRERYLITQGKSRAVADLLTSSLSGFLVLFRAALRLWQDDVPALKHEALLALAKHAQFDPKVFLKVRDLKEGRLRYRDVSVDELFEEYLTAVEHVVAVVNDRVRTR